MKLNLDKIMSDMNDWHIPCGVVVFTVGSVLQWFKHLDPSYVAFSSTVLGFLGGHAYLKSKNGGDDSQTGPPPPVITARGIIISQEIQNGRRKKPVPLQGNASST